MTEDQLIALMKRTGVILDGHFLLTSGKHSGRFLQCSGLMQHPAHAVEVCRLMTAFFEDKQVQTVIGPAMGGIILAYETARLLGARALFAEKAGEKMTLKRGFFVEPGEKVLVVEDAVTTGGSVRKVLDLLRESGANPVGVAMIVDRSGGSLDFGVETRALLEMSIETYRPEDCPLCRRGLPLTRPKDARMQ